MASFWPRLIEKNVIEKDKQKVPVSNLPIGYIKTKKTLDQAFLNKDGEKRNFAPYMPQTIVSHSFFRHYAGKIA